MASYLASCNQFLVEFIKGHSWHVIDIFVVRLDQTINVVKVFLKQELAQVRVLMEENKTAKRKITLTIF